jgi:LmbE family N-acetylglucosaminyl deacetylase
MRRGLNLGRLAVAAALLAALVGPARAAPPMTGPEILHELRSFRTMGTVLHVGAHPDDENSQLIAYLSRGRDYRTAYLSLTRGDGGQNEIGPEFGELLGVARTQELLAARRIDGGRQFFTRALDFGYSKDMNQTLAIWDRQQVVADIVRVIRTFRPDVIITRFPPQQQPNQHGHHFASALLAVEAFKLAGDPKAFPEQLADGLAPWQPLRILQNGGQGAPLSMQDGGTDPISGETFQAMAARSRSQHKTQGFGNQGGPGARQLGGDNSRTEYFTLLGGAPATTDIMDGVDTTWARVPGGAAIAGLADAAVANFKPDDPAASVPALLDLRAKLANLPARTDPVVAEKRLQLDRIIVACLGLDIETAVPAAEVVPGEFLQIHYSIAAPASAGVRLLAIRTSLAGGRNQLVRAINDDSRSGDLGYPVPIATPLTQPYWLREESTAGMFRVADTKMIGQPEDPAPFVVEYVFAVGGQTLAIPDEPLAPDPGKPVRRIAVISPVSLRFGSTVALFQPGATKTVEVEVTAARAGAAGTLHLEVPAGWTVAPAGQPFKLEQAGGKTQVAFSVTAPAQAAAAGFLAVAEVGGTRFDNGRVEIRYAHIPVQVMQPEARLRAAAFDFAIRGKSIGYLPGAGDSVADCLVQLGYAVTPLTGADLTLEKLRGFDAVVIGVRAFNERTDLAANLPGLFAYVENGGTVVAQYNRPNGLKAQPLGPYADLSIDGSLRNAPQFRVTDPHSPVIFLDPANPALTAPNRLGPDDFAGWVQERGAYFPSNWDPAHYQSILAFNDPGEAPLQSSVLIAAYGKGHYVYTGLGFFRQLPAAVPGAYRLFANLVSLGQR